MRKQRYIRVKRDQARKRQLNRFSRLNHEGHQPETKAVEYLQHEAAKYGSTQEATSMSGKDRWESFPCGCETHKDGSWTFCRYHNGVMKSMMAGIRSGHPVEQLELLAAARAVATSISTEDDWEAVRSSDLRRLRKAVRTPAGPNLPRPSAGDDT